MGEFQFDEWQRQAIEMAVNDVSPVCIINGGAGTGKTTIIAEICKLLRRQNVVVCAFAGKAAARLREKGIHTARTIHSVLGWNGASFTTPATLEKSIFIIDEASMIPSSLLSAVIGAKPRKLILVGDEAQLPPVGSGQPFHDLIRVMPQIVTTLRISHRATSAIYKASQAVRQGMMPPDRLISDDEDGAESFQIKHTGAKTHDYIMDLVRYNTIDLASGRDIILIPRNDDEGARLAVNQLNEDIHSLLATCGQSSELVVADDDNCGRWQAGDRVINSKNIPELDWWNGSTGTVISANREQVYIHRDVETADGEDQLTLNKEQAKTLSYAYAVTVHKSQGSEYRRVVVVCLRRDAYTLLDRSMLYTAITRAKSGCLVIGEKSAMTEAIRGETRKRTCLQYIAEHDTEYQTQNENDKGEQWHIDSAKVTLLPA